jgi:hypothetical protein
VLGFIALLAIGALEFDVQAFMHESQVLNFIVQA